MMPAIGGDELRWGARGADGYGYGLISHSRGHSWGPFRGQRERQDAPVLAPATGVWFQLQASKAGVYAQAKRGGLRLSSQSVGIWSWFQVAWVTLRIVRPPVRTILAAKSMTLRRSVVA